MLLTLAQDIRVIEGFGGDEWANHTQLHPIGAAMTALACIAIWLLPRRWAFWPMILLACFVAPAQRVVVAGLDFNLLRIIVLAGFARVIVRQELAQIRWHRLDVLILAFSLAKTVVYTVQYGAVSAFIYQSGVTFDAVGLYFLSRILIREASDVARATLGFVAAAVPVAMFFAVEHSTGRNLFSVFGGVPAVTMIREDRLRCQGAFAHPILAGCFWASLIPLMATLWWGNITMRVAAIAGVASSLAIVVFCASSTPVAGVMFGVIGALFFVLRRYMGWVRLVLVTTLIMLHLAMKAPVWHLIARVTLAKGSTSYFRFMLIDQAIHRFPEWALLGTRSTAHWFWGGQDVVNHYVLEGVTGGAVTLALFIAIIVVAFGMVGRLRVALEGMVVPTVLCWALGVSLFVHCTNFIGVSYFSQALMVWFYTLGAIGSVYERVCMCADAKGRAVQFVGTAVGVGA